MVECRFLKCNNEEQIFLFLWKNTKECMHSKFLCENSVKYQFEQMVIGLNDKSVKCYIWLSKNYRKCYFDQTENQLNCSYVENQSGNSLLYRGFSFTIHVS